MVFESNRWRGSGGLFHAGESTSEHRERLAREHEEMQQRKVEALAAQVSIVNSPAERIRIWEALHGLTLPRTPNHKLLRIVAAATDLQLDQVREVQRLRLQAQRGAPAESVGALPKS